MSGSDRPGQERAAQGRECSPAEGTAQPTAWHNCPWAVGNNEGPWEQVQQPEQWWKGRFRWAGGCEADPSCGMVSLADPGWPVQPVQHEPQGLAGL